MAGELVPFEFVRGRTDVSHFHGLTRPVRPLTAREQWVYNQLAVDWAQLDGLMQKAVYTKACMVDLASEIWEGYRHLAATVLGDVDRIKRQYGSRSGTTPPKRDYPTGIADLPYLMENFAGRLLNTTGTNVERLLATAHHEQARIGTRPLDPPSEAELAPRMIVRRGFWQRLLSGDGDGAVDRRNDWAR